jgi:hypothetical protein
MKLISVQLRLELMKFFETRQISKILPGDVPPILAHRAMYQVEVHYGRVLVIGPTIYNY